MFLADALEREHFLRVVLDDGESVFPEGFHQNPGKMWAYAPDHSGTEILLDPLDGCWEGQPSAVWL